MAFLFKKNRTHETQTRIVKHEASQEVGNQARPAMAPAYVTATLRDWRKGDEAFGGFKSPPGRF